jgi:hypothetical protein
MRMLASLLHQYIGVHFGVRLFGRVASPMEIFDDIAAIAAGEQEKIPLEDLVKLYEKDGVKRVLKFWRMSVLLRTFGADANALQLRCPLAGGSCTGRDREAISVTP